MISQVRDINENICKEKSASSQAPCSGGVPGDKSLTKEVGSRN